MIFADEPTFVETALSHGFVPDEPRRIEPDWAYLADDEDDVHPFMDEHGLIHIAGQWPAYGGL